MLNGLALLAVFVGVLVLSDGRLVGAERVTPAGALVIPCEDIWHWPYETWTRDDCAWRAWC